METRTFDQMTRDERWLGFGYLGERQHAYDDAIVDLADTFVYDVTADWTDEELFAWANSKDGRWFGDVMFGGDLSQRDLDMADRMVRKQ
jgi:hypothetical protein